MQKQTMTRDQKIAKIQEVMWDKTLSFGCRVRIPSIWEIDTIVEYTDQPRHIWPGKRLVKYMWWRFYSWWEEFVIIGHPVMIGDVLHRMQRHISWTEKRRHAEVMVLSMYKDKRKPIDDQSDECIDFIFWLIDTNV